MRSMNSNSDNSYWPGFSVSPMGIPSSSSSSANPTSLLYCEEGAMFSPLPLKSDGSLCIMEALNKASSTAKLEDFFNGAISEAVPLSLNTFYYPSDHQNPRQQQLQNQQLYPFSSCNLQLPLTVAEAQISEMGNWVSRNNDNGAEQYNNLQSLSLSMSSGSQSSCVTAQISPTAKKRGFDQLKSKQIVHRKSIDTFGQRTSQFRGVTRHRWTGRYEAHLWDNSCKKEGQTRKGRQVYLGGYDMEEKAARAFDLAALKYWGPSTHTNFSVENYQKELEEMKNMSRQECVAHLRRKSSGFSRGASIYRGVTRHHQHGRWQARIGRVAGNKDLYLGTFSTQEEAAEAYDIAAIKFRGLNAVTNFDITLYDVEGIMASNTLLAGESARQKIFTEPTNLAPENVIGSEIEESSKMGSRHWSNASSLVTSLNSSRECTPDRTSLPMMSLTSNGSVNVGSSWIQTPQLGFSSALALPQMSVFAAWDA